MGLKDVSLDEYEYNEVSIAVPEEAPPEFKQLDFKNHLHIKTEGGLVFWSKDMVNGQVYYFNKEAVDAKSFSIKLECTVKVRWSNGENDNHYATIVPYSKNIEFLGEKTRLESGYHVFPFSFPLIADKILGSLEVLGGSVRWILKAKVEKPGLKLNLRRRKPIRIIGDPLLPQSGWKLLSEESNPKFGFGYVPVKALIQLHDNQGYNKVTVTIRIENLSEKELSGYKLKVKRQTYLKVPKPKASKWGKPVDIVKNNSKQKIMPKEVVEKDIELKLPADTIPSIRSELIDVFHTVYLRVLKPAFRFDLRLDVPFSVSPPPKPVPRAANEPVPLDNIPDDMKDGKMEIDLT